MNWFTVGLNQQLAFAVKPRAFTCRKNNGLSQGFAEPFPASPGAQQFPCSRGPMRYQFVTPT
jgi:hypothetical protein